MRLLAQAENISGNSIEVIDNFIIRPGRMTAGLNDCKFELILMKLVDSVSHCTSHSFDGENQTVENEGIERLSLRCPAYNLSTTCPFRFASSIQVSGNSEYPR